MYALEGVKRLDINPPDSESIHRRRFNGGRGNH